MCKKWFWAAKKALYPLFASAILLCLLYWSLSDTLDISAVSLFKNIVQSNAGLLRFTVLRREEATFLGNQPSSGWDPVSGTALPLRPSLSAVVELLVPPPLSARVFKHNSKAARRQGSNRTLTELKAYYEPDLSDKFFNSTVLIATPLRNARNHLGHFIQLLASLNYPHKHVSIAFGEDSSIDGTYEYAFSFLQNLSDFRRVAIFSVHTTFSQGTDWASVHEEKHQLARRAHLAEARNKLLELALADEEYVLWVDSDVGSWRPDVVQHLLDVRVDVVVPACMYWTAEGHADIYDRNTWRETDESLARQRRLPKDELVLEGYGGQQRLYLTDLRREEMRLVEVDGVGGCMLLVRSELHRRGITFPQRVFNHHIETEGFAKMAKSKGYKAYGLPFLEVYHL